jgi:hypothetical protein
MSYQGLWGRFSSGVGRDSISTDALPRLQKAKIQAAVATLDGNGQSEFLGYAVKEDAASNECSGTEAD